MDIIISNSDNRPIYEQIYTQIKAMILQNTLREGDILPSMRILAKELRISVITTKRAYEELEKEGYIISVPGKGTFIAAQNPQLLAEEHKKRVEDYLQRAVDTANSSGISRENVIEMINLLYEEN